MKTTYDGPAAGVGAVSAWTGNNKVGEGRMTITDSRPNESLKIRLEFLKPFKATNTAEFTFKPDDNRTRVTWAMTGRYNFLMKGMGMFMNFDRMIGADFEKGLAQMNSALAAAKK